MLLGLSLVPGASGCTSGARAEPGATRENGELPALDSFLVSSSGTVNFSQTSVRPQILENPTQPRCAPGTQVYGRAEWKERCRQETAAWETGPGSRLQASPGSAPPSPEEQP